MNWNRQYRPKQIKDLHLTKVRDHFLSLLQSGKFSQVFLFAGPKGTGKTSTARIIAALLNDAKNEKAVTAIFFNKSQKAIPLAEPDPLNERVQRIFSGSSFMVQELDAASNRGIDDVRSLKERISLPPQDGLISVYILDEVHMLTSEAFNALLKLLEEPPPHVVFILATTELDKIPATVTSRAQVIGFTKATTGELKNALTAILEQEKIPYDEQVLDAVAERADGSFRDAVKLLEMIAQIGEITLETAEQVLALSSSNYVTKLIEALLSKNSAEVVELFHYLRDRNTEQRQFYTQLLQILHTDLLKAHGVASGTAQWPAKTTQFLLKELADPFVMTVTPITLLPLELKFLEIIDRSQRKANPEGTPPRGGIGVRVSHTTTAQPVSKATTDTNTADYQAANVSRCADDLPSHDTVAVSSSSEELQTMKPTALDTVPVLPIDPGDGRIICEKWVDIVSAAVKQNFGLATLLRSARPMAGETGKVIVSVYYTFHKEQLMQPKFKQQLDVLFANYAGGRIDLECILAEQPASAELQEPAQEDSLADLAVASLM